MKIGVLVRTQSKHFAELLQKTLLWLQERQNEVFTDSETIRQYGLEAVATAVPRESIPERVDFLIVFGGDGTLLAAARLVKHHKAPILGVNLGSLGFLTEVTLEELNPALQRLLAGDYVISRRCKLQVEVRRRDGSVEQFEALNDAVINKGALARIISMDAYCDDDFIANFPADGMIIATPTGSTAYSLSAGGPIISPTEELIAMTPICPHTLTARTLIVPADRKVRVVLTRGDDVMVTVDGQVGTEMWEGDELVCTRSQYPVELIQSGDRNFYDILREKLKWGER